MVDIAAPNLKGLYIRSDSWDLNLLININACVALKRLKLSSLVVTDQWLENLLPNLLNLEIFDLYLCSSLRTVKISSNRLKYLILVSCNNLIEVDLDTPNFLGFSSDVRYGNDIVNPLPAFHLKASPLLEVKLKLIPETPDTNWYSELTKSLRNFNHSKAICLCCDDYKVSATHSLLALPE
ncbi:putative rop guanine nucleotide exchange factor 12-like [Capsicum annuum]|nr:putative rop guanine nucleotide exchange factor 12-like [Capsicum annuum]